MHHYWLLLNTGSIVRIYFVTGFFYDVNWDTSLNWSKAFVYTFISLLCV